jgi:hypothetical protein
MGRMTAEWLGARALRGGSSKHTSLFRHLAEALPVLLRRRPLPARAVKRRQTQRRLTPQQVARLVAEYEVGADMKALAARWHMHRGTVAAHLRRAGVALRRTGVPNDRLDEAVRLYGEGWSLQRLAERYRCDDETVRQLLKRADVQQRKPWERVQA